ncbi:MAPEG family protein [Spectribacter hydrogenoxidans]|uniref:MAPEG family protein n=1 Tax=Spectribacter hydrogenoxidans TaxID=3075608 RepID=A0ABU3BYT8_9GAMM|nr:MAPEG family protein [Salinisphaera sp. W335]MDT0634469.1 MAPEG family protein [Salinisphaera sp. W335]
MTAFTAVLLYLIWMVALTLVYAGYRIPLVLTGQKSADHWSRGRPSDDPPILQRAKDAHLNCVENFALFAGVVLVASAMGEMALANVLGAYVLYARIGQSVAHLIGTSFLLVLIRATFFIIQLMLILYMAIDLL